MARFKSEGTVRPPLGATRHAFYLEPRHGGACRKEKARPTPATRQDDISKFITKTLRKRLRDELDRGVAEANATVCGYLFGAAKAGNIPAIIFWLKTRAHRRGGTAPNEPIPGADAESKSEVVLVLPDNSRNPELTQVLRDAQEKFFARKSRPQPSGLKT